MLVYKHSYGKFQEPQATDPTYSFSTENDKVLIAHIWRNLQRLQIDQWSEYSVWQRWNIIWRQVSKSEKEIKIVIAFADSQCSDYTESWKGKAINQPRYEMLGLYKKQEAWTKKSHSTDSLDIFAVFAMV